MPHHRKNSRRPSIPLQEIPEKANRVLNAILIAFILIILRIWHLGIIQHESKLAEARKPQKRVVIEPSKRATIRDRYNIPLAINKVHYQASILYSQLKQIPSVIWVKTPHGGRTKRFQRKEYIKKLSSILSHELGLDPDNLEDLIHAKGAFYGHLPLVIKEDLSETEYYRLKMLETHWPGMHVQHIPKRDYPKGKVAADIIGYMGAIDRPQFELVLQEIQNLEAYIKEREEGSDPSLPLGIDNPFQARKRLRELRERAYTVHDSVGKTGIERQFEQQLRGFHGKKSYFADARGNFLREIPGRRDPVSGQRVLLTISSELQEYAEKLLAQNEKIRWGRIAGQDSSLHHGHTDPWIKGGAIVAMHPQTGEILAMASYPRYDPNDFILSGGESQPRKNDNIHRWFETEKYVGEIWDQKRALERERFDDKTENFYEESIQMNWEKYLQFILPKEHPVLIELKKLTSIKQVYEINKAIDSLFDLFDSKNAYWILNTLYKDEAHQSHGTKIPKDVEAQIQTTINQQLEKINEIKKYLNPHLLILSHNYDKALFMDLCRLILDAKRFTPSLIAEVGHQSIELYRAVSAASVAVNDVVKTMIKQLFHEIDFKIWRSQHEKEFLKAKRLEEKEKKIYPKPYTDYLNQKEKELFQFFWNTHRWDFVIAFLTGKKTLNGSDAYVAYFEHLFTWHQELKIGAHQALPWRKSFLLLSESVNQFSLDLAGDYLQTLRGYDDLARPLLGRYRSLRNKNKIQLEKHLAAAFYPTHGYGYGRSQAFRQAATQGSLFKLVTSYAALIQRHQTLIENGEKVTPKNLNPLEMTDQFYKKGKDIYVGYTQENKLIPQLYKGGRLLKSVSKNLGKLDLLKAIETSSNPYFSLLAGDILNSPLDLEKTARNFGYGARTGVDIPLEISGKMPTDLESNRTGLYAMANGQHSLVVTPLQTSVMLSAVANKGKILKPKIISLTAGRQFKEGEDPFQPFLNFPYEESLNLTGIDFPLFSAIHCRSQNRQVDRFSTVIRSVLPMPDLVHRMLAEGMFRVVQKQLKEGLGNLSRIYREYPGAISDLIDLKYQMLGKTSTAESLENLSLDLEKGIQIINHVWFGAIAYPKNVIDHDLETLLYKNDIGDPELIVVVYLRYGAWGKEAAPIGAQIIKKWREIQTQAANYH